MKYWIGYLCLIAFTLSCSNPQLNQNKEALLAGDTDLPLKENSLPYEQAASQSIKAPSEPSKNVSDNVESKEPSEKTPPVEIEEEINLVRDGLMSEAVAKVYDQVLANPYKERPQKDKFLERYEGATEVDSIFRQIQEMLCSQILLKHEEEARELIWGLSTETCLEFTKDMDPWLQERPDEYIRSIAILIDELPNDEYTNLMKTLREWFMQTSETIFPVNPSLVWGLMQKLFDTVHSLNWKDTALIRSQLKAGKEKNMWDYSRKWMVNISIGLMLARTTRNLASLFTGSRYVSTAWRGLMQRTAERSKWLGNKVVGRQYELPRWRASRAEIKGREIKTKVMHRGGRAVDLSKGKYRPQNDRERGYLKGKETQTLGQVSDRIAGLEKKLAGSVASTQTSVNLEINFWRRMCFNFKNYVPPNEHLEKLILLKQAKGYTDQMISSLMAKEGISFAPSVREVYMDILKSVKPASWWRRWLVAEGSSRLGQVGVEGAWLAAGAAGGAVYGIYRYNNLASKHIKHYKDSALQIQGEAFASALKSYDQIFTEYLSDTKAIARAFKQANEEKDNSLLERELEESEYDKGGAYIHYFKEAQTIMFGQKRTEASIQWLAKNFKGVVLDENQVESTLSYEKLSEEDRENLKEGVQSAYLPEEEQGSYDERSDSSKVKMRKVFYYPEKTARLHAEVVRRAQDIFVNTSEIALALIQKIEEDRARELEAIKAAMESCPTLQWDKEPQAFDETGTSR